MSRAIVDTPSQRGGPWALARYLVDAMVLEKRSHREVARAHGVSKRAGSPSWSPATGQVVTERSRLVPRRCTGSTNRTPDEILSGIIPVSPILGVTC